MSQNSTELKRAKLIRLLKNNPNKFPEGYIIELDKKEKEEVVKIFDNLGNLLKQELAELKRMVNDKGQS